MITKTISILGDLNDCFLRGIKDIEIEAANSLKGLISERVFNNSAGVEEKIFGSYRSASYKKKREAAGRQTKIKDLQFTGTLKNDLNIGNYNGKVAVGFSTKRSDDIVMGQESEKQIGFPIFSANNEEVDITFDEYISPGFDKLIKECLKS